MRRSVCFITGFVVGSLTILASIATVGFAVLTVAASGFLWRRPVRMLLWKLRARRFDLTPVIGSTLIYEPRQMGHLTVVSGAMTLLFITAARRISSYLSSNGTRH
jgi:hypothetical protein